MKKFACDFDAIEIEAHEIVPQENPGESEPAFRYEPVGISEGALADVWSVFGHVQSIPDYRKHGEGRGGRELIADCETPEAADFIAQLVRMHIINGYYRNEGNVTDVPIHWYTEVPLS